MAEQGKAGAVPWAGGAGCVGAMCCKHLAVSAGLVLPRTRYPPACRVISMAKSHRAG